MRETRPRVLVVDDEDFVRESVVEMLESEGIDAVATRDGAAALAALEREPIDLVLTDLRMPNLDGQQLLERARRSGHAVPVIVLTGAGSVPDAVLAMQAGAWDFVLKPVEPDNLVRLVRRALEHGRLVDQVSTLRRQVESLRGNHRLVGTSSAMAAVRSSIARVAPQDATVLVSGESGTGKELVALEIHAQSVRRERNLVRVNCAAVTESLFESEFFGHRRGAFTGAVEDRSGRFAEADGGTLALDEIGTLRPEMQAKLLRVLETGEYQVVGESRTRIADVRVVALTNEDLAARVEDKTFRADLFYRLNVFPIVLPTLRERRHDVGLLADHFLEGLVRSGGPALSRAATAVLESYSWPGNVRELRNVLERAVILSEGRAPDEQTIGGILESSARVGSEEKDSSLNLRRRLDELESELLQQAIASTDERKDAAAMLGIDPRNLGYYLRKHGLGTSRRGGADKGRS